MIHVHVVVEENIKSVVEKRNCNSIELHLGEILGAFFIKSKERSRQKLNNMTS